MLLAFPSWTLSGCRTNQGCEDRGRALHRIPCRRLVGDQSRYVCGIRCKVRVFSFAVGSPGFYFLFLSFVFSSSLVKRLSMFFNRWADIFIERQNFSRSNRNDSKITPPVGQGRGLNRAQNSGVPPGRGHVFFDDIFY